MSTQTHTTVQAQPKTSIESLPKSNSLQRTCSCGQHTLVGGECTTCRNQRLSQGHSQRASVLLSAPATTQENIPSTNAESVTPSRFTHDFSQLPIHTSHPPALQTKLTINQPGDAYEQEADQIAAHVMRMTNPQLQRICACGGACPTCQTGHVDQEHEQLQDFSGKRLDNSLSFWSKVQKLTIHMKTAIDPLSPDEAKHPVSQIDIALSEGLTRRLLLGFDILRDLKNDKMVTGFENGDPKHKRSATPSHATPHSADAHRDFLLNLVALHPPVGPMTSFHGTRNVRVVRELGNVKPGELLKPRNPDSFPD